MTRGASDETDPGELHGASHVGRVGLRVGSLERVRPFYEDVVGLAADRDGDRLTLGPTPDEPLLVLEAAPDAPERPRDAAGLFHVAIRVPGRAALGDAVTRLRAAGASLSGASDHLVSEALYLRDPEGLGLEVYCDRPREAWPDADGGAESEASGSSLSGPTADDFVGMETLPLDLADLEAAGDDEHVDGLPPGTDVGHVHLEVTDLPRAEAFYRDALGLRLRDRYGASAAFLAADGYHHHVGLNAWNGRSAPAGDHRGLAWWELVVPDADARGAAGDRLEAAGHGVTASDDAWTVRDPDGMRLRLVVED